MRNLGAVAANQTFSVDENEQTTKAELLFQCAERTCEKLGCARAVFTFEMNLIGIKQIYDAVTTTTCCNKRVNTGRFVCKHCVNMQHISFHGNYGDLVLNSSILILKKETSPNACFHS